MERRDTILLVREKSDGRWTLPGGFADVGHSASENVVAEMREEAGLTVCATQLYGLRH
ncbi:NUDIX domain-containing protein [Pleomorphomonas oryzae]|uniref:NUDIX domain-containing protein n=1 Tax=Pleomorphomonas oryzae TaxID=261934 RepID=UPI00041FBDAA|nr:NUDIX domain-containing protein [Pleomorphomonas oryzae]